MIKTDAFERDGAAIQGYAVRMKNDLVGEIIVLAPTQVAVVRAARSMGLPAVDVKRTARVSLTLTEPSAAGSEQADELHIGVSNNDQGVHVNIMQRHADGTSTIIYAAKAPAGDSFGLADLSHRAASAPAELPEEPTDALLMACGWEAWTADGYVNRGMASARYEAIRAAALSSTQQAALEAPASAQPVAAASAHDAAVDRFAAAMKAKMAASRAKGRSGWDNEALCPAERLQAMLVDHLAKGDPVDVGNFAMMLWNRGEPLAAAPAAPIAQATTASAQPAFCLLPPPGWHCTRAPGHDGPCAAWPEGCAQ